MVRRKQATTMNAADALVDTLARAGVEKVFGVIGTSTLDIADAINREQGLEFVSAREEEAAAHMADGYARATGRVGVVLAHVGPGALRLMYGVGTAWKDSVPMVVLTGNEVLAATDTEMREGYHVIPVEELYRPITKGTLQLSRPEDARRMVGRAFWLARSGRPGPVLIDLPKSTLKLPFDGPDIPTTSIGDRVPASPVVVSAENLARVADLIKTSSNPVLLAGAGVHWSNAHDALRSVAEQLNLPILTTDGGRGAIPEDHALSLGVIGRQAGDAVARALLEESDVVIALGTPLSDVSTYEWTAWPNDTTLVQVDISPDVGHRGYSPHHLVVADIEKFLVGLGQTFEKLRYRCAHDWQSRRIALDEERRGYLREGDDRAASDLVNPWVIIDELTDSLPRDSFISVDSGMHGFFGKKLRVLEPRTYVRSAGFGAMGYSFPGVLGALESDPDRHGVAIVGDGCLAMELGEFETAARRGSSITVIVFNDSRFASQQSHQLRRLDGRIIGTDFHVTDFVKIAEAQGVPGWTVTDDDAARKAIREAMVSKGPTVIDARVDPEVRPSTWIEGSGDQRLR
ncbi:MAG: hypothetical protein GEU79_11635 [Acidimicrobiia bacterium]|nr:hypothetical protein [Acidimicrobiia bacterium]